MFYILYPYHLSEQFSVLGNALLHFCVKRLYHHNTYAHAFKFVLDSATNYQSLSVVQKCLRNIVKSLIQFVKFIHKQKLFNVFFLFICFLFSNKCLSIYQAQASSFSLLLIFMLSQALC